MATFTQLLNARDTLNELAGIKLPPRLSLKVARSAQRMFEAMKELQKERSKLLKAYAEQDDKGEPRLDDEKKFVFSDQPAFKKEMEEALDEECEIEFTPIQLRHIPKKIEFTAVEANALVDAGILKE